MLVIDGSAGEGGGQILRTSLLLSLLTRTPIRVEKIRAGRKRPGLRAQHVTCVRAAAEVGRAAVEGAEQGSDTLTFRPTDLVAGDYAFDLGTAGSTSLVLQTVLPALAKAKGPSQVWLTGGTHNSMAPPFDFLDQVYLPLLARMGPQVTATLERHGFYPKGGGRVLYQIQPTRKLEPLELLERGPVVSRRARALLSQLPEHVAERELVTVGAELGWNPNELVLESVRAKGPGNALILEIESEHAVEVVTAFGSRGTPAERVARDACVEARAYLDADVPVGEHLADQLLLLLAIAGGGRFRSVPPSGRTLTQIELIPRFLDVRIERTELGPQRVELFVSRSTR